MKGGCTMNNNYENSFDALIDYLKSLPQATVKMIDLGNYSKLARSAVALQTLLQKQSDEGEITLEILDEFNMGSVTVELPELQIYNPADFIKVISECDNFEVYPLTNGNMRLSVTFHGVLRSVM